MDTTLSVALHSIKLLAGLITDLRNAPDMVKQIDSQLGQLSQILRVLHAKSQTHILTQTETVICIENQDKCNGFPHQI
jgi:hypothetical protein